MYIKGDNIHKAFFPYRLEEMKRTFWDMRWEEEHVCYSLN